MGKSKAWRGLAALALIAGLAAPGFAADKLHVGKASPTSSPMLPVNVGVETGIFAKRGLDVEIEDFSGGAKMHQAMTAGSVEIGVGAGPELALIAKGAPDLAICNPVPPATFIGIAVPQDSPLKNADDLKGKSIGITSAGSLTYWLALELARHQGWGPDGIKTVAIGGASASIIAAFRTHAVDAMLVSTSLAFDMEEKKEGRLLIPVTQYEGNISGGTIFATKAFIAANPETIRRFLAAWFDTVDYMRSHRDETVKIASGMTGFSNAVQAKEYDLTIGMYSHDGKFDKESLANLERSFTDLKLVDTPPDMTKLYTEEFLPKR
jgi:ABC-type nitrate/sulfonate/bicarbonate transport system substrate-binding protein